MSTPLRVLIAEDEGLLRETLAEVLRRQPDLEVVATCGNGRDALLDALGLQPDVVLTDLRMPRMDGIELTAALQEKLPRTAVVVLTVYEDDEHLIAALDAGAAGYVVKHASVDEIAAAIRAAGRGEGYLAPGGLVRRVMEGYRRKMRLTRAQRELFKSLTRRELDVLKELAAAGSNGDIAAHLHLSVKTVRNHVSNIMQKLEVRDRTEAALLALRYGLGSEDVHPHPPDPGPPSA